MSDSDNNPFLTHLCKELSIHLDAAKKRQTSITPSEFAELVSISMQEVLEAFTNGEFDLQNYRGCSTDDYKLLAQKSIDSYSATNEEIGKISETQAKLIEETSTLIDFGKISEKFNDIQNHLNDEVVRANEVIMGLKDQVKSLEIKTTLDPLTKTYNRHALHEHLHAVLHKKHLDFEIFALMIDVDNFKSINDQYGHIAGDKVLIFITKLMKKALRDGDRVYRFGGEEFIILLNRTDMEGARLVGERLLSLCRHNKPLFQNKQITVTLSIGLTKIKEGDTMDTVIGRSDIALYRAKDNGKDRMEMEF
jgi:diguanylate cyclase